ncbi:uncharacterized protein METZ01_LOCUS302494 [marine metagenome]|uniref:Uncharacterized protein n=1 Tax=marine metagenome TaxID=408172 RepID=A0A382MLZ0_9ZZZZ
MISLLLELVIYPSPTFVGFFVCGMMALKKIGKFVWTRFGHAIHKKSPV